MEAKRTPDPGGFRRLSSAPVQPLKAAPRSRSGRLPGASRTDACEASAQAPHPAPCNQTPPEDALGERDAFSLYQHKNSVNEISSTMTSAGALHAEGGPARLAWRDRKRKCPPKRA